MSEAEQKLLEIVVEVTKFNNYRLRFPNKAFVEVSPLTAIQFVNEQKLLKQLTQK